MTIRTVAPALPPVIAQDWEWQLRARCRSMPVNMFYSAYNASRRSKIMDEQFAKAVCRQCQVRNDCLRRALEVREPYGVWGGLSADERAQLSRP
ncbi:WhiB family transcriptional regulator [Rhodococcus ruber]|uniref:Transcriptional regulator WhiB n=1 Tax=Rhodococcus ruber TaxID=1830 RepID=A0ABT4MLC2_9NOCA|nr:WhiB family transcriptional regulator [Rhodococcus ruber]MCZ4521771.1 WhiB family transcriptional regulator [Rhodococcus ruber]